MEYSEKQRRVKRRCYIRIMNKIINAIKMTTEEMEKYIKFINETLPLQIKSGDTVMDELNLHIKYFKGVDILTYYTPTDPTKDKEPILNKTLQNKWLPQRTVAQKIQLKKESEMRAKNKLKEGPVERERARKKEKKDQKIVRVMKQVPINFYTCNANHITNKMPTLAHDAMKERLDVIHITEAGLKQQIPAGMTGYKAVTHPRPEPNRGSVMWVRECLSIF